MNIKYLKTLLLFSIFIGNTINVLAQNATNTQTNFTAVTVTNNILTVIPYQNISNSSLCYSFDGQSCYQDFLAECNSSTGYNCSTSDQINPALASYCISDDNVTCIIDDGTYCNSNGSQLQCNIQNNTNNCPTQDGQNCYNPFLGMYMTYDGVNVSPIDSSLNGSYCESNDGITCNINNGPDCDLDTGYLCATSDMINVIDVYQCYTQDQVSCIQDDGTFCNFTGSEAWCNLNYTSDQLCTTQDGQSCYNFAPGWYITYDGQNTSAIDASQNGTYCYSQDGQNCYQDYGIGCDEQTGQLCSIDSTGALISGQYCLSMDDSTCFSDQGSLCNFTGSEVWCKIANDTQSCFTQDQATCYFPSIDFINTGDNTTQSSSSPFAIQFRVSLRDYFFYAISGQEKDASKIGVCDVGCDQWSDKCCANVVYQSGDQIAYDNLCINRWVVQFNFAFQLNGANFTMKCVDSTNYAVRSFAFIQSMLAVTTIISAFIF